MLPNTEGFHNIAIGIPRYVTRTLILTRGTELKILYGPQFSCVEGHDVSVVLSSLYRICTYVSPLVSLGFCTHKHEDFGWDIQNGMSYDDVRGSPETICTGQQIYA